MLPTGMNRRRPGAPSARARLGACPGAAALAALAASAVACGDRTAPAPTPGPAVTPAVPAPAPAAARLFPADTRSLRLTRTIAVRLEPDAAARQIGTIAQDTRVRWTDSRAGKGCTKPWVAITPRGWVCAEYLEASTKVASGVELPRLDKGELVPGVYGKVFDAGATTFTLERPRKGDRADARDKGRGPVTDPDDLDGPSAVADDVPGAKMIPGKPVVGSVTVRQFGELTVGGKTFWKISNKPEEYLARAVINQHRPSEYAGVRLGDDTGLTLPIAFLDRPSWTRGAVRGGGTVRQLPTRSAVPLLEPVLGADGKPTGYRVGDAEWIDARGLRIVEAAPPPALIGKAERWLDVDLDRQVVVAYEGRLPVYAALVSTGAKDTPTTPGVYRMWRKVAETDMRDLQSEDPYSVATVPWTQFFSPEEELALHTAYWHDKFGVARSHGCVNLAPRDARWLYFWSEPLVPPGWTMATGVVEAPGSIVRVRSREVPDPPHLGYAKRVQEERQRNRRKYE